MPLKCHIGGHPSTGSPFRLRGRGRPGSLYVGNAGVRTRAESPTQLSLVDGIGSDKREKSVLDNLLSNIRKGHSESFAALATRCRYLAGIACPHASEFMAVQALMRVLSPSGKADLMRR